jgi:hypothetical protein
MYLFFIRAFNDIDHITPIVWKMRESQYPVAVYCLNPAYDLENDYRIDFLRKLGIEVDHIYKAFDQRLGSLHRVLRSLTFLFFHIHRNIDKGARYRSSNLARKLGNYAERTGLSLYKLCRKLFYGQNWAHDVLEQSGAKLLCFDWVRPKRFVVEVLLQSAKKMAIPVLSLPHGVFIYTKDLVLSKFREEGRIFDKYNHYDYVIVQNELFKNFISSSGVDRDKILVLGSARYCDEWMKQNNKIIPRIMKHNDKSENTLKVVFMSTRFAYSIHVERMYRTLDMLSSLNGVEVLIKPHTRTGKEGQFYENLPLPVVDQISSVELCGWADVMLVIGSSILIETQVQKKPVLYLKYLHDNTTLYEEFGACWTIHDEDELKDALLSLQENRKDVPYKDDNVNQFISEIIYGGPRERDVLKDYVQFIVSCAQD